MRNIYNKNEKKIYNKNQKLEIFIIKTKNEKIRNDKYL